MKHFKLPGGLTIALLLACSALLRAGPAAADPHEAAVSDIKKVIEVFRSAIVNKEKEHFLKLFYHPDIPWLGVTDDESLTRLRARDPGAEKVSQYNADTYSSFIAFVVDAKRQLEETFENTKIDTDGEIATVAFDYSFMIDGYKQNWGKEAWQLVRTSDGWKINSVIYSLTYNRLPPPWAKTGK